jgi:hypothetical protein
MQQLTKPVRAIKMAVKAPYLAVSINIVLSTRYEGYQMRRDVGARALGFD